MITIVKMDACHNNRSLLISRGVDGDEFTGIIQCFFPLFILKKLKVSLVRGFEL